MAMQTAQRRALRALVQATGNALKTRPLASHAREISIMHSLRRNFGIQEGVFQRRHAVSDVTWAVCCSAVAAAATACAVGLTVSCEELNVGTLNVLAKNVRSLDRDARTHALNLLLNLTVYLEHHESLMRAGVFDQLYGVVVHQEPPMQNPEEAAVVLGMVADLMKVPEAQALAVRDEQGLVPEVVALLSAPPPRRAPPPSHPPPSRDSEGKLATSVPGPALQPITAHGVVEASARILAELSATESNHPRILACGGVRALVKAAHQRAHGSLAKSWWWPFGRRSEAQSGQQEEEARFLAAGLFGMAGSRKGRSALLKEEKLLPTLMSWATASDVVLHRYAVGALARLIADGEDAAARVIAANGVPLMVSTLKSVDPQAQCYASGALKSLAGTVHAHTLQDSGALRMLVDVLKEPGESRCRLSSLGSCPDMPQLSGGVDQGVQVCIAKALARIATHDPALKEALLRDTKGALESIQTVMRMNRSKSQIRDLLKAVVESN